MTDEDIERIIEVSDDEVRLEMGGTRILISGILSKRHAQILVALLLAMLGYHHESLAGLVP